jgi:DNA-binding FrmR family transcriptional regulator
MGRGSGDKGEDAMEENIRNDALKRMNYIEGHLAGIKKMLEEDRYCVDILKQTYAVRRALEKMEASILEGHLRTHVVEGIKGGHESQILEELMDLFDLAAKNKIGGR